MAEPAPSKIPETAREEDGFDFSTPEGIAALTFASGLVMELREELHQDATTRKLRLYERTLGLAVVPVLFRRVLLRLKRVRISSGGSTR